MRITKKMLTLDLRVRSSTWVNWLCSHGSETRTPTKPAILCLPLLQILKPNNTDNRQHDMKHQLTPPRFSHDNEQRKEAISDQHRIAKRMKFSKTAYRVNKTMLFLPFRGSNQPSKSQTSTTPQGHLYRRQRNLSTTH